MKKVFLVANEKALSKKRQKGVSMVSLVITIIVMLILAGIIFLSSTNSIEQAGVGVFVRELALVRQAASEKKLDNQIYGTSEENTYKGFYKTKIKNPPANFVSFSETEIYGYVIDLEYVHTEDAERGHDYKRFATNIAANVVEFGVDDVYVLDKEGNIFYAKGWETDDGIHYSNLGIELHGPEIVAVNKIIAADAKSATISVVVRKKENGSLNVKVGDFEATRTQVSEDGLTETFEATVNENKTYVIIAEETGAGRSTSSIEVTELNLVTFIIKYLPNGTNVLNIPADQTKTEKVSTKLSNKIPERAGYTFLGWNENGYAENATYRPGGEFIKDGAFDGDTINLFAIWKLGKEETYSVSYNANGGTNAPQGVENISGDYTITTQEPQRDGFAFLGWSKNPKATTAEYSAGATITLTENVTLYAVWSKGTYSVTVTTYPEGAGTVTGNALKPDGVEVFVTTTRNPGYVFKNWTVKSGGVNLSNSTNTTTSFTMPKNSVELVANYEVEEYIVKFNANRGTGAPSAQEAKYGEEIEIPTKKPTRAGYDFKGWALKQDANVATHQESQKYIVTQSVTFYAVWQVHIETYTLKFNLNGGYGNINGEIGKFVDQTKTEGAQIVIPIGGENEPYKEGFVFKGWALTEDSTDVVLRPGDTYSRDADLEIFAVWKDETPPTITLEPKQEEGSDETSIVATAYDGGKIAEYAWTMSNTYPTAWQTDGISGETVIVEKVINQKGAHYFWAKDLTGNYTYQLMNAYEVKYDGMGGNNTPATQYQLQNTDLTLTEKVPSKERYVFLGWSIAANPGNTTADVNFQKGEKFNVNADTVLRAVWGEAFFDLSAKTAVTQIDGANVEITVTKGAYTGEISVTSSDTDIATATITGNIITIVPGTKIGDVEITVVESQVGTTEKIVVTVERGIRKVSIDRTEQHFTYGDSSAKIEFLYNGKTTGLSTTTSNATVATATASEKTLTITPENNGTAIIGLVLAQDDQYLEKTVEVQVTVGKKQITITPKNNQSKVYDGTISTPILTFTYTGNTGSEVPKFNGELTRDVGGDVGKYEIKLGSLSLLSNNDFIAENYEIVFSTTKVYFEITPKRIIVPTANTPQEYDGTVKEGIAEGEDYVRGGEYQKTNAGKYTAIATLKDTKNFVWDDTNTTNAKNIGWEITSINLLEAEAKVDEIPSKVYTGYELKPLPVVRCKGVELINGTDYTVSYSNNINVGYATITISGKGNYRGVIEDEFEIVKATMEIDAVGYNGIFDNQEHSIKVSPIWPSSGYTIYYSETQLTSSNYTTGATTPPKYKTPTDITTYYYIKAPNFNDYSGSANVKIKPKDIGGNISILGIVDKSYTGNEITQIITVKDNEQNRDLVENAEFTIAYSNNIKVGIATITLTGIGNYTGTKEATFNILGDVITISRNTEQLVTELEITITKTLPVGTLQYKINNGSWIDYTGKFTITEDCTIFAQSVHNGDVIGTSQLNITNICEHDYTVATCTEDSICKYCGLFNSSKLGHEYTSETATPEYLATAATCTDAAVYYHKCIRCTAKGTTTYEYGDPLGHEFTSETATAVYLKSAATCTEKAVYYHKCIRCTTKGTTTYAYGNPLGHEYTKKEITADYLKSEATCTEAAIYYFKCIRCDEKGTNTYTVGEPAGHDFTVQIINGTYLASEATCTMPAQYYYKCSKCDAKSTETYSYGEATGHSFGDFITITEANCIQAGSQRKTCKNCGTSVTEEVAIDPTNHYGPITYEDTVEPTCTTTGTRKYTCTACGEVVKYETLAALGHEWNAPEPPRKCNRCGLEENTIVQAIYTASDGYLRFIKDIPYTAGNTYNGKTITAVYTGFEDDVYSEYTSVPWTSYNTSIKAVTVETEIAPVSTAYWFYNFENCSSFDVTNIDTTNVTSMYQMFYCAGKATTTFSITDMSNWNTSNVTNMYGMFWGAGKVATTWNIGDIGNWDVEDVTDMGRLFYYAGTTASNVTLNMSNWNTAKVTNMYQMFKGFAGLKTVYATERFSTSAVTNSEEMFTGATSIVGGAGTTYSSSRITHTYARIDGGTETPGYFTNNIFLAYNQEIIEVGDNVTPELTILSVVFNNYTNIKYEITSGSSYATINATTGVITAVADGDVNVKVTLTASNGDTISAETKVIIGTIIQAIYSETDNSLRFIDDKLYSVGDTYNGNTITSLYTDFEDDAEYTTTVPWYSYRESVTSVVVEDEIAPATTTGWFNGFTNCSTFDVANLDVSKVDNMEYMFWDAALNCTSYTITGMNNWDVSKVTNMSHMFGYAPVWVDGGPQWTTYNIGNLSNWDTSKVTDMTYMFTAFGAKLTTFDLSSTGMKNWDVSSVTDMTYMFNSVGYYSTTFNLDMSDWWIGKTSSLEIVDSMFSESGYKSPTYILNLSNWDMSSVKDFYGLFEKTGYNASTYKIIGLDNWNMSNATDLTGMFYQAGYLATTWSVGNLSTKTVTNSNGSTYTAWDVSNVKYMSDITPDVFEYSFSIAKRGTFEKAGYTATTFNIGDIGTWDTSSVETTVGMFSYTGYNAKSFDIGDLSNWDVSKVTLMGYKITYTEDGTAFYGHDDGMFSYTGYNATNFDIGDLENWDTSNVTNMNAMFYGCQQMKTLNMSNWSTANITTMEYMFGRCYRLEEVTLGTKFAFVGSNGYLPSPNSSYITGATGLWYNKATGTSYSRTAIPNNTAATYVAVQPAIAQAIYSATDNSLTFIKDKTKYAAGNTYNSKAVTAVYTGFEDNATKYRLFYQYDSTVGEYVETADTPWFENSKNIKKVVFEDEIKPNNTNCWFFGFENCSNFDVSNLNVSNVEDMSNMFYYGGCNASSVTFTGLNRWNTSNVTKMTSLFYSVGENSSSVSLGNISEWDTSSVTDMSGMFGLVGRYLTTSFNIDVSNWDVSNVTNMYGVFRNTGVTAPAWSIGDLSGWNTSKVTNMSYMFAYAGRDAKVFNPGNIGAWDTSKVIDMSSMFTYTGYRNNTTWYIGDLSNWNTSSLKYMTSMFRAAGGSCSSMDIGDLGTKIVTKNGVRYTAWDTSNVIDMSELFMDSFDEVSSFDIGNIGTWNTSNVTNMTYMFKMAGSDSLSWNIGDLSVKTVRRADNTTYTSWDTSKVQDMSYMFHHAGCWQATTFNLGDLSNWNVSNVKDMCNMFSVAGMYASTFYIGDISKWNTANVTDMTSMFANAGTNSSYTLNLSGWNVNNVTAYSDFNYEVESKVTPPKWVN